MDTQSVDITTAPRLAWSIAEAAKMLSVSQSFIRKAIDAGSIPVRRLGRRVVIKDSDLRAWLERVPEEKS